MGVRIFGPSYRFNRATVNDQIGDWPGTWRHLRTSTLVAYRLTLDTFCIKSPLRFGNRDTVIN